MKIGEARAYYGNILSRLQQKKEVLLQQKNALHQTEKNSKPRMDRLERQLHTAEENCRRIQEYMSVLHTVKAELETLEKGKEQVEAETKQRQDEYKCLKIFHRIARGDRVPPADEKKLMEYDGELYMAAKNLAMLAEKRGKKHASLWEEEAPEEERNISEEMDAKISPVAEPMLVKEEETESIE